MCVKKLTISTKLKLYREHDNKYDEYAVLIKDKSGNKLGHVPREDNRQIAGLIDDGRSVYATVTGIDNPEDGIFFVNIRIFMDDSKTKKGKQCTAQY